MTLASAGSTDAFLAKYDPNGTVLWCGRVTQRQTGSAPAPPSPCCKSPASVSSLELAGSDCDTVLGGSHGRVGGLVPKHGEASAMPSGPLEAAVGVPSMAVAGTYGRRG